ncbi:MAG: ABC transporter permease subunit [Peptococcia bacterium]
MDLINHFYSFIVDYISTMIDFAPKFLPGVIQTLQLAFFSIFLGTFIGLIVAILKLSNKKILIKLSNFYITIVRGTPLLLQLYFIFFGKN